MNKEFRRMMELAGLTEIKVNDPGEFPPAKIIAILNNNGFDEDYFDEKGERAIEGGTEGWLDVLSDVIGKSAYDDSKWEKGDGEKIMRFIQAMEDAGIELQ
jgi:hypothetical protein